MECCSRGADTGVSESFTTSNPYNPYDTQGPAPSAPPLPPPPPPLHSYDTHHFPPQSMPPGPTPGFNPAYRPVSPTHAPYPGYPPVGNDAYPEPANSGCYSSYPLPGGSCNVPYAVMYNPVAGGAMALVGDYPALTSFNVYALKLQFADQIFNGQTKGWNREYKAAQSIFSDAISSKALRKAIQFEHATLYKMAGKQGTLHSGEDFLRLVRHGRMQGQPVFFTYVLLQGGTWRFSHTGVSTLKDNLSKHAMHSNASREVLYAGEFHIEEMHGSYKLVVDNNSGTYAPPKERLQQMVQVIQMNFPGLMVDGYDRNDPRLQAAIDACPSRRSSAAPSRPGNNPPAIMPPPPPTPPPPFFGSGPSNDPMI